MGTSLAEKMFIYYRGADKSLARPGRKWLIGHLQPRRNRPTWASSALITHPILRIRPRRTTNCSLDWKKTLEREVVRAKDLSAPLCNLSLLRQHTINPVILCVLLSTVRPTVLPFGRTYSVTYCLYMATFWLIHCPLFQYTSLLQKVSALYFFKKSVFMLQTLEQRYFSI
jgi:hypothetical protein